MIRICYHPDLASLSQFEKLVLTLGRWPQFFVINLSMGDMNVDEILKNDLSLLELINGWRAIKLDTMERKFVEILALTGRGKIDFLCSKISYSLQIYSLFI